MCISILAHPEIFSHDLNLYGSMKSAHVLEIAVLALQAWASQMFA